MTQTARARAYLMRLPPAIAGQRGHDATFRAACALVKFGLGEQDAWNLLVEWNATNCQPRWAERELRHKLRDAYRVAKPRPALITGRQRAPWRPPCPASRTNKERPALPPLRPGTPQEIAALAELRGLGREGVALASSKGLLRFGDYLGQAAWFITDSSGRVAQARRLDGALWECGAKALTLRHSQAAWPVGILEANPFAIVALVEGGPDLLALCHFLVVQERESDVAPVAMLGGSLSIHAEALRHFKGKRVRIFPHVDKTGADAAARWAKQLREVGATVDGFSFAGLRRTDNGPVKDLCDLAQIHADDFEHHRNLWSLFP